MKHGQKLVAAKVATAEGSDVVGGQVETLQFGQFGEVMLLESGTQYKTARMIH